jgi:hypothetical protein
MIPAARPLEALAPPRDLSAGDPRPAATARPPSIALVGVGLTSFASTLALSVGLQALFSPTPGGCGADCASALARSGVSVVLGIPALAWATALHALLLVTTWSAAIVERRDGGPRGDLRTAQLALVVVLLGGSAAYLVLGLAGGVRCPLCLTMHALAVVASLGIAILPKAPGSPLPRRAAAATLVLAAWVLVAFGLGRLEARRAAAALAPAASTEKWLAAVCAPDACPGAARFGPEAMPDDGAAIVLGSAPGATLVAWLDLECAACRADFAAEAPLFRELARSGRGARLLLRGGACEPGGRGDPRTCEAPAAVICAARHGGPAAALDHLGWELSAEPGFYTIDDRRRALAALGPTAARCLDAELALGTRGTLAAHARAARRLARSAEGHAGCGASDLTAWWCFSATPSFAIVDAQAPGGQDDAFASARGDLRREVLEQCLEPKP